MVVDLCIPCWLAIQPGRWPLRLNNCVRNSDLSMTMRATMNRTMNGPRPRMQPLWHTTNSFDHHDRFVWCSRYAVRMEWEKCWMVRSSLVAPARHCDPLSKMTLTQIKICATARFPIAHAIWIGVLRSRPLTGEFISSAVDRANSRIRVFMSDLQGSGGLAEGSFSLMLIDWLT